MITFEHHGITVKCKPENAAAYRAAMDKPPKLRPVAEKRDYPKWSPDMSVAGYVQAYIRLNERRKMIDCAHDCANYYGTPTLYDPTTFQVEEELDPDWVPPAPKPKAATSTQLKARIEDLEGALHTLLLTYYDEMRDASLFNEARKVLEAKP